MGHLTMLTTITEVSQNWTTSNFTATLKKLPCCGAATLEQTCLLTTPWKVFTRHRWAVTFTTLHLGLNFLWRSSRQNHAGPSLCWFTFKTSPLYLKDPQQFVDQKHIALHNSRGVFFCDTCRTFIGRRPHATAKIPSNTQKMLGWLAEFLFCITMT